MTDQAPEPLSAEEEAELRRDHVRHDRTVEFTWVQTGRRDTRVESDCAACGSNEPPWPCDVARLLATLTVERAARANESLNRRCPACMAEGERSIVRSVGAVVTAMMSDHYWDEDGNEHFHDPNWLTTTYSCSRGHRWAGRRQGECPRCGDPS